MKFYIDGNIVTTSEVELQNMTELSQEQITFYLANRNANVEEILAMQLNPVPEPEPYVPIPTEQERIEALEDVVNLIIAGEL